MAPRAVLMAGVPAVNLSLFHRVRFRVGDPVALIEFTNGAAKPRRVFLCRDIELERARRHARADECAAPKDYAPAAGLSPERETATAQAAAECLRRAGISSVVADRTLPLLFAHVLRGAGIEVSCDPTLGVLERRAKDDEELAHLDAVQRITEHAVRFVCETIAGASAAKDGTLVHDGAPLTSERLRTEIDLFCLRNGCDNPGSIVASGPQGGDCHERGSGPVRTGEPVIVDIFPRHKESGYNGDCTRTVVHGEIPAEVTRMHAAVVDAKQAAESAARTGATGGDVHAATLAALARHGFGFSSGSAPEGAPKAWCGLVHGTGHGVGLDVHEPPLLDVGGPALVTGDVITIEPGLYSRAVGGIRIEDMVTVTPNGSRRLGAGLPQELRWR